MALMGRLGWWQHLFGAIVTSRSSTGGASIAVINEFLLVDIIATWKEDGPKGVVMYLLAPEKAVFGALVFSPKIKGRCWEAMIALIGLVGTILSDLCAIERCCRPPLRRDAAALMAGYGVAGVTTVFLVVAPAALSTKPSLVCTCAARDLISIKGLA